MFFSANNHQRKYFSAIVASCAGFDGYVVDKKLLPLLVRPFWPSKKIRNSLLGAISYRLKEKKQEKIIQRYFLLNKYLDFVIFLLQTYYFLIRCSVFLKGKEVDALVVWNGNKWRQIIVLGLLSDVKHKLYFENGVFPNTTTFDDSGVNYKNSIPRNLDFYQRTNACSDDQSQIFLEKRVLNKSKRNGKSNAIDLPNKYIFVPFQVDYDSQVINHSPWLNNMLELYQVLSDIQGELGNDYYFVVKEHPSSKVDYSHLHELNPNIVFANEVDTQQLIENAISIVTINSSVGFESILLSKNVIVVGDAFYGIDGLVSFAKCKEELKKQILSVYSGLIVRDNDARLVFINYVKSQSITGSWREPASSHFECVERRILNVICS